VTGQHRAALPRPGKRSAPQGGDIQASDGTRFGTSHHARRDTDRARPGYVIEIWVSEQLGPRHKRSGPSLWQALEVGHKPVPAAEAQPDPEPEAEP